MHKSWAVLVLIILGGCDLYFGGDDEPPPCDYGGIGVDGYPSQSLRDPYSGICQDFGYPYPCDDVCGPCAYGGAEKSDIANQPDWGACYSACEGLGENACIQTAGCFAAYLDDPAADGKRDFYACWQTPPSGPIHGTCTGNDAQQCSRHDDCSAVYADSFSSLQFLTCVPESSHTTCAGSDCAPGYHCEEHCYGDPSTNTMDVCQAYCVTDLTCAAVDCAPGYECAEVCDQGSTCHPTCVPTTACETLATETACQNRSDCTPVYIGMNCTCTIYGCSCQDLTYDRCETL
ncbi:MAG TPA: hypothetical protein VMZ53_33200 [Kofleriaceae bacterium]|nr:hypothetical protein [Kofleriaceae bacterium]